MVYLIKQVNGSKLLIHNRRWKFGSIIISVIVHIAFIFFATMYKLPGLMTEVVEPQRLFQIRITKDAPVLEKVDVPEIIAQQLEEVQMEAPAYVSSFQSFLDQEMQESKKPTSRPTKQVLENFKLTSEVYDVEEQALDV